MRKKKKAFPAQPFTWSARAAIGTGKRGIRKNREGRQFPAIDVQSMQIRLCFSKGDVVLLTNFHLECLFDPDISDDSMGALSSEGLKEIPAIRRN